jgi:hypothetical protein
MSEGIGSHRMTAAKFFELMLSQMGRLFAWSRRQGTGLRFRGISYCIIRNLATDTTKGGEYNGFRSEAWRHTSPTASESCDRRGV